MGLNAGQSPTNGDGTHTSIINTAANEFLRMADTGFAACVPHTGNHPRIGAAPPMQTSIA